MNRLLTILLLLGATAHGQINNPPTSVNIVDSTATGRAVLTATNAAAAATAIGLGTTNYVGFGGVEILGDELQINGASINSVAFGGKLDFEERRFSDGVSTVFEYSTNSFAVTPNATFSTNVTVGGTLAVTGNATLNGVDNLAPSQTASSGSSLMTRDLSDDHYLGEMWNASRMAAYNTTNPPITVFRLAPMVTYTDGQAQGPYMEEFVSAEKYAGKTVRVLGYCRADSTNGGNVQGALQVKYLTNTAGGPDSNYALTAGGQSHGTIGVYTNVSTDVFPVATSTNQYLIFTSNVGTIPTNAKMIIVSAGFNRASANTTYTNNLYMHAVQLVVENP